MNVNLNCNSRTVETPVWALLNGDPLTRYELESITQGGCASGAHMDAVTYYTAAQTMTNHGDDVTEYLESAGYTFTELLEHANIDTWGQLACYMVSTAVESFAAQALGDLNELEEEEWEDKARPIVSYLELSEEWQKEARSNHDLDQLQHTLFVEPTDDHNPGELLIDLNECVPHPGNTGVITVSNSSAIKLYFDECMESCVVTRI